MRYVIGIDEVGRGSLAGPLFVAAAAIPSNLRFRKNLKDSKGLSAKQREEWFQKLKSHPKVKFAISKIYPRAIERKNVSRAANLAALRAFNSLTTRHSLLPTRCKIFLDGGLYLGNSKNYQHKSAKNQRTSAITLIKGDEKINAIKIASIIAKVSRDKLMTRLARKYPAYKFETHKGYGTRTHYAAIKKFGPSEIHRRTFIKIYLTPR